VAPTRDEYLVGSQRVEVLDPIGLLTFEMYRGNNKPRCHTENTNVISPFDGLLELSTVEDSIPASATTTMSARLCRAWNDFTIGTMVKVSALLPA
jgi:hypothetical protein